LGFVKDLNSCIDLFADVDADVDAFAFADVDAFVVGIIVKRVGFFLS
jgi:hypothetical protein